MKKEKENNNRAKLVLKLEISYDTKHHSPIMMHSKLHSLVKKLSEDGSLDGYHLSHKIYDEGTSDA